MCVRAEVCECARSRKQRACSLEERSDTPRTSELLHGCVCLRRCRARVWACVGARVRARQDAM
eukprot:918607-Pleurochrysis_carterae.AAC.2